MAIYIVETKLDKLQTLKNILRTRHEDTFNVSLNSLLVQSGPSRIKPKSIIVYKGEYNDSTMADLKNYCRKHQVPLLAIVDKRSFREVQLPFEKDLLLDVVTEPTDNELLLRVNFLLKYQQEMHKRMDKEKELEGALNHITEELEFAKKIQHLVLPREFTEHHIKFTAIYEPSAQLSGDLYFWIKISPHEYGFILIDVSGHGVHASLVSMAMRSLFPGLLKRVKEPGQIAKELNQHMLTMFEKFSDYNKYVTSYFTAIILTINTEQQTISYVNAGHQPGLLLDGNKFSELESSMIPIGLIDNPQIDSVKIRYEAPARLLLFTDGLTEVPYSIQVNQLDKVKKDFIDLANKDEHTMLQKLVADRKNNSKVLDDICAVAITLN